LLFKNFRCVIEKKMQVPASNLPRALSDLDSFASLSAADRSNFSGRIEFINTITKRVEEFFLSEELREDFEATRDLVDNLELDLMSCLSIDSRNKRISPWIVHSSWTFESSAIRMRGALSKQQLAVLQEPCPTSDASRDEFLSWASRISILVSELRLDFLRADDLDAAIGRLVGLDIALSNFLVGVSRQRLNPNLSP
jgi:hypothetical protein